MRVGSLLLQRLWRVLGRRPLQAVFKIANPFGQAFTEFGQFFRAETEQRDSENYE